MLFIILQLRLSKILCQVNEDKEYIFKDYFSRFIASVNNAVKVDYRVVKSSRLFGSLPIFNQNNFAVPKFGAYVLPRCSCSHPGIRHYLRGISTGSTLYFVF